MSLKKKRDMLGLVSLGFFLALVGAIFAITPNWYGAARDFVEDFQFEKVSGDISLPAPAHPYDHKVVYTAVQQFCIVWGILQTGLLVARFYLRDTADKRAETFSGIIFWLGVAYTLSLLLAESIGWFAFWAWVLIFIGLTLVARSLVVLLYKVIR